MLTPDQVNELADTMVTNGIASLEVKGAGYAVRLVRDHDTPTTAPRAIKALSPTTGTFRPRGGDDGLPKLNIGALVACDEPLGYITIGLVHILCLSPTTGRIRAPLPTPQQGVATGDPLFTIEPRP